MALWECIVCILVFHVTQEHSAEGEVSHLVNYVQMDGLVQVLAALLVQYVHRVIMVNNLIVLAIVARMEDISMMRGFIRVKLMAIIVKYVHRVTLIVDLHHVLVNIVHVDIREERTEKIVMHA